jgi:Squalene-hopene cyclase C-terminal domain
MSALQSGNAMTVNLTRLQLRSSSFLGIFGFLIAGCAFWPHAPLGAVTANEQETASQQARRPIPSEPDLARAETALRKAYARDFASDQRGDGKLVLAAKLLQPGRENRDDPASWFVLLRTARDLAAQSGRAHLAFEAIRELEQSFAVDGQAMRLETLAKMDPASGEEAARSMGEAAVSMIKKGIAEDNYALCQRVLRLAARAVSQLPGNKKARAILASYRSEVDQARKAYDKIISARARLAKQPDDAHANAQVGEYLGLIHARWDEALPYLTKGDDEPLRALAVKDLSRPSSTEAQIALADGWWHHAETLKGDAQANCQVRAAHWYEEARYRAEPFEKPKIEGRIKKVAERGMALPVRLVPGSFYGRDTADRIMLLREGGGNMQSEEAVQRGLHWLSEHQARSGMWSLDKFQEAAKCICKDPGQKFDVAGTAFGLLPMLAAGNTHLYGPYAKAVNKGVRWLLKKQTREGNFSDSAYENALATIAVCEDYGLTHEDKFQAPAQAAVNYIVRAQFENGSWGYSAGQKGDLSISGFQFTALKTAVYAGLFVPSSALSKFEDFLQSVADPNGLGYGYNTPELRPSTSAVGLMCREYLGWGPTNPALRKGVMQIYRQRHFTISNKPGIYFLYYATQVMHHYGGKEWQEWNKKVRDLLIETQDKGSPEVPDDHQIGSWSPVGDEWAIQGGRIMYTSLALLTLEVYYANVPLYQYGQAVRFE